MSTRRYLWIIRHGKAADDSHDGTDFSRELSPRGQQDGAGMQQWLAQQPNAAEWLWSSTAARAVQTANFVSAAFEVEAVEQDDLYLATATTMLDCLRSTPEDVTSVALVAHNPGLTYLVNQLAAQMVTDNLKTWGCAHFVFHGDWSELGHAAAELITLMTPKAL